jgi:sulfoxide reductase heme-binding subunit YedZ
MAWICTGIFNAMTHKAPISRKIYTTVIFISSALPFLYIVWLALQNHLGTDPAKKLALMTGAWTIRFLLLTLLISSLARLHASMKVLLQWRRMIGLFAFFYASLHLLVFIALFLQFDAHVLWSETNKRPYILAGTTAWMLLLPLALTSNARAIKRLGGKRWKLLHRLVYLAILLGVVHVIWQVRASWFDAILYSVITGILLLERLKSTSFIRSGQKMDKQA